MPPESPFSQIVVQAYPSGAEGIDWATWISAISTFVLVAITAWYAWKTHLMMALQKQAQDLEYRPMLVLNSQIEGRTFENSKGEVEEIEILYRFTNVGKVPVNYRVVELRIDTRDFPISPRDEHDAVHIFPTRGLTYRTGKMPISPTLFEEIKNITYIKAEYWTLNQVEKKYFIEREFQIIPIKNGKEVAFETNFIREYAS